MRHDGEALRHLTAAYKSLVRITQERMTAEQVGHLKQVELRLMRAMAYLPRNKLERVAVRDFIERMMRRDVDPE